MAFLSISRLFLSLKLILLFPSLIFNFTSVVPSSFTKLDILSMSLTDLRSNKISLTGLLKRSFKEAIFWTLILLDLFSSLEMVLIRVIINELPSMRISLFISNVSEKIKSSKTPVKSVNLITPYGFPLAVFLSVIFKSVAAIFASFIFVFIIRNCFF